MSSNGVNGSGDHSDLPGPGLWLVVIDGGVGYLARTTNEVSEAEVAKEIELTGEVRLTLQPIYVLDCVRAILADANRNPLPYATPITQRLDARIGLPEDFPVHMKARAVAFLSQMTSATRATLVQTVHRSEKAIAAASAARAGIVLPRTT